MKKKIILIVLIGVLITILFLIPKDTYAKIFGVNNSDLSNDESTYQEVFIYMCDKNDKLVGVFAKVDALEEDLIKQKFDILTKKCGIIDEKFDTLINQKTKLLKHEKEESVLKLYLSEEFLDSEGRNTLEQLAWTYCDNEISAIEVFVNDQKINVLNGFYFDKISLAMGINITLETSDIFNASTITVFEYIDNYLYPTTYLYKEMEACDFIISKLFDEEIVSCNAYDYVLSETALIIDISSDEPLSNNLKSSIEQTILYNMDVSSITIQGINNVLLEINSVS